MRKLVSAKCLTVFIMFAVCGLYGCTTATTPRDSPVSENYVQDYLIASSVVGHYESSCHAVRLDFKGEYVDQYSDKCAQEFLELAEHYGDTAYHQMLPHFHNRAVANEFDSIEVTSDSDFSTELPAGASLGGVVKLCSTSPIKFIESGYTEEFHYDDTPEELKQGNWSTHYGVYAGGGYHPVFKYVSELVPEDMRLLAPHQIYLRFTEIPDIKSHKITVVLKWPGSEISTTVDVVFE